jgi:phenylalanyl-tRNA synthetase alpha chain
MADVQSDLESILKSAVLLFTTAQNIAQLDQAKASVLGKSGSLTLAMKSLAKLAPQERKQRGIAINHCKKTIEKQLDLRRQEILQNILNQRLQAESIDVSLPGRQRSIGALHPISLTLERIETIFSSMGFDVADGPELETDWYSFTALNNPPNHPARSMQDTFYVNMKDQGGLPYNLRPHTSPMQIRYAQAYVSKNATCGNVPEIRVIVPGRTYRVDNDATHSPMFHQVEGLWLGQDISFTDLKFVLARFFQAFFGVDDLQLRFRPSFFPFTEPSAEVDIQFQTGKLSGKWLEVAGSGQVHPKVVRHMGLDPEETIGFAFGMGVDRLTMLKYGVDDLRQFFEGDIRFLSQFSL